jgi:uncharacterized protein (TIGR03382 family)
MKVRISPSLFLGSVALLWSCTDPRGSSTDPATTDRNSADVEGIVDRDPVASQIVTGEPALARSTSCDNDQALDGGETLQIKLPIKNPGPVAVNDVSATVSSSLASAHIDKPTVKIGKIDPSGIATATFSIDLDDTLTAPTAGEFSIEVSSSDGGGTLTVPIPVRLNTDDKPDSSATDSFDAGDSVWTATHEPQGPANIAELWAHVRPVPLDGKWAGADRDGPSDASLVSPEIKAGAGMVTVSFTHTFAFQFTAAQGVDPEQAFDGGVIEYTTDGGATWKDVSTIAAPGYNKTLVGTPAATMNPLAGRPAYGSTNTSFPNPDSMTLNFGTTLANQTFQLRFRIGSDSTTGASGWTIDNVAFTGIVGTPFPTLVPDTGHCAGVDHPKIVDNGGGCQAGGMAGGNVAAALGVLALLLRRRRRS